MGVGGEVERRRLQAAVRELGIHGATQVSIIVLKLNMMIMMMIIKPQ